MGYDLNFFVVAQYWPALIKGYLMSLGLSVFCYLLVLVLGLPVAVLRMSRYKVVSFITGIYIDLMRGLPTMVFLVWVFFALPILVGYDISKFAAAVIALSVSGAAYQGENYRAGIQSVPRGHVEAARSLGMSHTLVFFRIVMPQAIRVMIPPMVNEYITLLKGTALAFVIGLTELMHTSNTISIITNRPLEVMTVTAVFYLLLTIPMAYLGGVAGKFLSKGID